MTTMSSPVAPARNAPPGRRHRAAIRRDVEVGLGEGRPARTRRSSASASGASSVGRFGDEVPRRRAARGSDPSTGSGSVSNSSADTPASLRAFWRSRSASKSATSTWSGANSTIGARIAGDRDAGDATGRRQQEPRLAARRGEVPQRLRRLLLRLVAGLSAALASGSGRAEVNRSDPSGRNSALLSPTAERVSRRGAVSPGRIHLPQRGAELLAVGARGRHRHHQARAVGRQPEPGESRKSDEMVEIEGVGHGPKFGRPSGATVPQPEVARVATVQSPLTHDRCP